MRGKIIGHLVKLLLSLLTPELLRAFTDMLLDFVEEFVLGTKSKVDDAVVLPLCETIRETFNIPD